MMINQKSNVLANNGEAPKSYAALTVASISSASIGGVWDFGVSMDTSCNCVHMNCQILKI